ncbi:MAG: response regulator [Nitrospira sp.]
MAVAAVGVSDKVDRVFFERYGDIQMLARAFGPQMHSPMYLTAYLQWMQQSYHVYRWLGVTDVNGHIIAATDPSTVGQNLSMTSGFQAAKREGATITEDMAPRAMIGGALAVLFAAPIRDANGEFKGVVTSLMALPALGEMIQRIQNALHVQMDVSTFEYIVVTKTGDVIADSLLKQEGQANLKSLPSVQRVHTSKESGYVEEVSPRLQVPTVTGYARMRGFQEFQGFGWGILVRVPRDAVLAPIDRVSGSVALAGLLVFLPLVALVLRTATRLRAAEREVRHAQGQLEARVEARTQALRESESSLQAEIATRREAEAALRQFNDTLEAQVQERTAQLSDKQTQLRALAAELSRTEEQERKRLATDLHDHVAQLLALTTFKLDTSTTPGSAQEAKEYVQQALTYIRTLLTELNPPLLGDKNDFSTAIAWVLRKMERHGLHVDLEDDGAPKLLSEELVTVTYQAIQELLFNVLKHAQTPRATLALHRIGDEMQALVEDHGVGFDSAVPLTPSADGGFGLFNIRERLDLLDGQLTIASTPGKGTRAILRVPLKTEAMPSQSIAIAETQPHGISGPVQAEAAPAVIRILLVDDHRMVREGLRSILEGHADLSVVGQASDGLEGIEAARRLKPDVVLMDINMPKMNGVEATRHLLAEYPQLIVIGLSMQTDQYTMEAMRKAGAVGYVSKAEAAGQLVGAIRTAKQRTQAKVSTGTHPAS